MIKRYSRPKMQELWSDKNRFQKWLDVELAVLKVLEEKKIVPKKTAKTIKNKAKIDVLRIAEHEKTLRHDVIAFTTSIAEQVGKPARFFHFGLTSSDVVDTALSMLLKEALLEIQKNIKFLNKECLRLAKKYKNLPSMGRTHGVHAEPMSFGLKFLGWFEEFKRQEARLRRVIDQISYGKLSGAVGCYGVLSPEVEEKALRLLGLKPETVATQVLPRDRHAELFCWIAQCGSSIERVATELRHLQRTEVHEIEEEFGIGQKGSSAMPHKKNPISAENLTGCARLLRGYAVASLENVALWHERDISHSSVERVIAPDATILLDYMLSRLTEILMRINVRENNISKNLNSTKGIYFSGHVLLKLVERGFSREKAYKIVQQAAHHAWEKNSDFKSELLKDKEILSKISLKDLAQLLDVKNYLRHVDKIYKRSSTNEKN